LFTAFNANQITQTFKTFQNYRYIISGRLGPDNPYSGGQTVGGYAKGYGKYAQDVLIPAFIAAYSGQSPNTVALINESNSSIRSNPFSGYLPKPNWRISYNGLSRLDFFKDIFTSFNLSSAYSSTLSMNSFNTSSPPA